MVRACMVLHRLDGGGGAAAARLCHLAVDDRLLARVDNEKRQRDAVGAIGRGVHARRGLGAVARDQLPADATQVTRARAPALFSTRTACRGLLHRSRGQCSPRITPNPRMPLSTSALFVRGAALCARGLVCAGHCARVPQ
eukprot:6213728-Pleurochrysis_carterae.AAC.1